MGAIPLAERHYPYSKEPAVTDATNLRLPLVSTGCACCAPSAAQDEPASASPRVPFGVSTVTTYQVEGMTCGHCAGRVTEALTALEGVLDVQVDLVAGGSSAVTVTSTTPVAEESVRAAVARAGYAVTSS